MAIALPRAGSPRSLDDLRRALGRDHLSLRRAQERGRSRLQLVDWVREAGATEEFEWRGRARKIVPDAFVVVADKDCECRAFVEVDLGSMSMTRLSQKLSGYAAYYAARAWVDTHPFAPVLLLLTTSESRAEAAIRRFD